MARFRLCRRRHLLNSLRSTVDYRPTLPRLIRTLVGSQKLQSIQPSSSLYCAYRSLRTGLRGRWCRVLFARRLQVLQPLRLNTPLPPPQRGRLESLLAVYAEYEDNTFVKNSLLPIFDIDKTNLLPSLRF